MDVYNWGTELVTHPRKIKEVFHVQDIIDVVTDPDQFPSPVRALGSRHSPTKCIDADGGTVLDMRHLNFINEPNEAELTITVGSGAIYYDIAHFLQDRGFMLHVNTEIGNLTAGAAVMAQTKDASFPGEYGQVSSYVVGVKMVTAQGEILEIDDEHDPELMTFIRCSYGLLGIVYEVTFQIKPLRLMRLYHKVYTLDEFLDDLDDIRASDASVMYYMLPFHGYVAVEYRSYAVIECSEDRVEKQPDVVNNKHLLRHGSDWQFAIRNVYWAKIGPVLGSISMSIPRPLLGIYSSVTNLVLLKTLGVLAGYRILPAEQIILYEEKPLRASQYTFSINTFSVGTFKEAMRDYFAFVRDYYERTGWRTSLLHVGYRVCQDTRSYLSYTADGESMSLDPVTNADGGWYPFLKDYNKFCMAHNGKPLMNQAPLLTHQQVDMSFGPMIKEFNVHRKKMDPDNRFLNNYFRELFAL